MTQLVAEPLPGTVVDPFYPDSDGRPMGETDYHTVALIWLREGLEDFFADVADAYVASNLLLYYQKGDPKARRDPDVLVAKGVGKHRRRSFRVWEEKRLPNTLFEVASKKTWRVDLYKKPELYARIGINEYFLFDPEAKFLPVPLMGFRGVNGVAEPMTPAEDGSLVSTELGVRLVPEENMLRLIDLATGQPILTRTEQALQAQVQAEEAKEQTEQAREQTEQAKEQTEQAREQTEQAQAEAEQHRQHSAELAAEVERLKALLAQYQARKDGGAAGQ